MVVPPHAREKSADINVLERVLTMLSGIDKRIKKIELSQAIIAEDERMQVAFHSGMFSSMLGADFAKKLHRDTLDWSGLRNYQAPRPAMKKLNGFSPTVHQDAP